MLSLAAILLVAGASAQETTPEVDLYFAHFSSPHLPTVRLNDVRLAGQSLGGATTIVTNPQSRPLVLTLALELTDAPTAHLGLRVRLESASASVEETRWILSAGWKTGESKSWESTIRIPPFTVAGVATLTISQLLPDQGKPGRLGDGIRIPVDEALVFRGPVFIEPARASSKISASVLDALVGSPVRRLNAAFRLAPNTTLRIALPDGAETFRGVGFVLAMGGGFDIDPGTAVAKVRCEPGGEYFVLRAGEDVSFVDRSSPPPGVVRLGDAGKHIDSTAPFADWHDAPVHASIFGATREFGRPANVESIVVEYVHDDGHLDVLEIVGLIDSSSAP